MLKVQSKIAFSYINKNRLRALPNVFLFLVIALIIFLSIFFYFKNPFLVEGNQFNSLTSVRQDTKNFILTNNVSSDKTIENGNNNSGKSVSDKIAKEDLKIINNSSDSFRTNNQTFYLSKNCRNLTRVIKIDDQDGVCSLYLLNNTTNDLIQVQKDFSQMLQGQIKDEQYIKVKFSTQQDQYNQQKSILAFQVDTIDDKTKEIFLDIITLKFVIEKN